MTSGLDIKHPALTLPTLQVGQDSVALDQLGCHCIIGILPEERLTPQPLEVQVSMELDLEKTATTGSLSSSVDYSQLVSSIVFILKQGQFHLIESAAVALVRFILIQEQAVQAVRVRLTKPNALGGLGIPSVSIRRHRSEVEVPAENSESEKFFTVFSCPETTLELHFERPLTQAANETVKPELPTLKHQDLSFRGGSTLRILNRHREPLRI
jgi:FolB domain-containing protein